MQGAQVWSLQETISYMQQLRVSTPQLKKKKKKNRSHLPKLKITFVTIKTWRSQINSVQFSRSVVSSLQPHWLQYARLPCPSPSPRVSSNSCPSSRWCHPTISSSVIPFSSWLQSFPASGSFSNESVLCIRWTKYWSFSLSISPSNDYSGLISLRIDWLISLKSKGLSRVFSNTTVQKHQIN